MAVGSHTYDHAFISLFTRVAKTGRFDWTPFLPMLYARLLRITGGPPLPYPMSLWPKATDPLMLFFGRSPRCLTETAMEALCWHYRGFGLESGFTCM